MKKLVSIILSLMLLLSMAACSTESAASSSAPIEAVPDITFDIAEDTDTNIQTDTETDTASSDIDNKKNDSEEDNKEDNSSDADTSSLIEQTDNKTSAETKPLVYTDYGCSSEELPDSCKIFRKVVCCGDSYTAGFIADSKGEAHTINEDYAWPHYMSALTGNDWYNCGCSGCNVITWQKHERGLPTARKLGRAQAYVIGLMINDVGTKNHVELGTSQDIGTDKETYYGGMSKIIKELNKISPEAKIFVNTCPKPDEGYKEYNNAVREIVEFYEDTIPVHCIDLEAHADMYNTETLKKDYWYSHYTAIGYEQFAEIYAQILNEYINDNIEDFRDVAFIEYDK